MDNFNDAQAQRLMDAPLLVLRNVMDVDGAGFFNAVRESKAAMDFVRAVMEHLPENTLIQQAGEYFLDIVGRDSANIPDTPTLTAFLDEMGNLTAMLGEHPHAWDYRVFLYGLAEQVAGASGTGLFGRGSKISSEEDTVLTLLKVKLAIQ